MKIVDLRHLDIIKSVNKFDVNEPGKSADSFVAPEVKSSGAVVKHVDGTAGQPGRVQVSFSDHPHTDVVSHLKSNGFKRIPNKLIWHAPVDGYRSDVAAQKAVGMHSRLGPQISKAEPFPVTLHKAALLECDAITGKTVVRVSRGVASVIKALMPSFAGPRPVNHAVLPSPAAHAAAAYAAQMPKTPGVQEHPTPTFETNKIYGDGNGNYHPSRVKLHDELIHKALNGGMGNPGDTESPDPELHKMYGDHAKGSPQKHGIFLMGGGGSGKGYYKNKKLSRHPRFVNIDPDEIKEHLAHADGDVNGHNIHPENYHEESSDVAKRLHAEAMKHGKSFIYDGTGAGKSSLEKKLKQTNSNDYKTSLHYVMAPLDVARERNQKRSRTVPEHILIPQHAQVTDSFAHNRQFAHRVKVFHSI